MPLDALDNMPSAQTTLTSSEAYRAMLRVLEYYFRVGSEYPVCDILSQLSPGVWADGSPGDPASWGLWLKAIADKVQAVRPGHNQPLLWTGPRGVGGLLNSGGCQRVA